MADLHYDNYIFDLYGTLVDIHTDEYDIETWNKWAKWLDEKGLAHPSSERMRDDYMKRSNKERPRIGFFA